MRLDVANKTETADSTTEGRQSLDERVRRIEMRLDMTNKTETPGTPTADGSARLDALCDTLIELGIEEADRRNTPLCSFIVSLVEKRLIEKVLASCHRIQSKAAHRLGINRNTLHKKTEEFGIPSNAEQ
jgi:transcriptional regulator of acetoin/glycerol metabolism